MVDDSGGRFFSRDKTIREDANMNVFLVFQFLRQYILCKVQMKDSLVFEHYYTDSLEPNATKLFISNLVDDFIEDEEFISLVVDSNDHSLDEIDWRKNALSVSAVSIPLPLVYGSRRHSVRGEYSGVMRKRIGDSGELLIRPAPQLADLWRGSSA